MLVGTSRLNNRLSRERDQSNSKTLQDLNNDDFRSRIRTLPKPDHQPISKSLDRKSKDQSRLQPPKMSNEDSTDDSDDSSGKTWDGSKSACGKVRFVPGYEEESVEVPIYDSTRHGMEQGDQETSDDVLVLEKVEWDQRVWGVLFFVYSETDHETCAENKEDDTVGY